MFSFGVTFKYRNGFGLRLRFVVFKYLDSYCPIIVKMRLVSGLFFLCGGLIKFIMDNYARLCPINDPVNNLVHSLQSL